MAYLFLVRRCERWTVTSHAWDHGSCVLLWRSAEIGDVRFHHVGQEQVAGKMITPGFGFLFVEDNADDFAQAGICPLVILCRWSLSSDTAAVTLLAVSGLG